MELKRRRSRYAVKEVKFKATKIPFTQIPPVLPDPRHNCDACTTMTKGDDARKWTQCLCYLRTARTALQTAIVDAIMDIKDWCNSIKILPSQQ
jgi:hypothetical protein